jgi:hypothetical protein
MALCFDAFSSREPASTSLENALGFCFDAFSSREPVPTSLENALAQHQSLREPRRAPRSSKGAGTENAGLAQLVEQLICNQ